MTAEDEGTLTAAAVRPQAVTRRRRLVPLTGVRSGRVAFVLGGGGRWGAVEVGVLRALVEAGLELDLVIGTSIGAINGAVLATDPTSVGIDRLNALWSEVAASDLLGMNLIERVRTFARLRVAIEDPRPIRQLLERALPVRTFDQLAVEFHCVAASIERAAEHWFTTGPLIEALLASSAVPSLFPPVEFEGEHFYDGGLVNSVPVDRAVHFGGMEIYVLQVGRLEAPLRAPTKFYEAALLAFEIARRHRFASARNNQIPGVELRVLPSANEVEFDDLRQINWSDFGGHRTSDRWCLFGQLRLSRRGGGGGVM